MRAHTLHYCIQTQKMKHLYIYTYTHLSVNSDTSFFVLHQLTEEMYIVYWNESFGMNEAAYIYTTVKRGALVHKYSYYYEYSGCTTILILYPPENKPPSPTQFTSRCGPNWGGGLFSNMQITSNISLYRPRPVACPAVVA